MSPLAEIEIESQTPTSTRFSGVTQKNFGLFDSTMQNIDQGKVLNRRVSIEL